MHKRNEIFSLICDETLTTLEMRVSISLMSKGSLNRNSTFIVQKTWG